MTIALDRQANPSPAPFRARLVLAAIEMAGSSTTALIKIGERLQPIVQGTQSVTLAGFRLLDSHGRVVAGRGEIGLSLAHVEEVQKALQGHYKAVMRTRISKNPPPPLYSLNRGTSVRVFSAMPVIVRDHVAGVVYASRTPNNIIKHVHDRQKRFLLAGLSVIGVTLVIGFIFSRAVTKPIHTLVARTSEVGHDGRRRLQPLDHHGTREIALLTESFMGMAERLHRRSDSIAAFATHVSHELKTPLTSIQGAAELLRDDATEQCVMADPERLRFLDNIIADTARLGLMLHRLRELAQSEMQETAGKSYPILCSIELASSFPALSLRVDGSPDLGVAMSAENLLIVLAHIADNSTRHHASLLDVAVSRQDPEVLIIVRDDGDGISEANRDRIFEAFFTTRRETGGTGMGLGIVRAMLEAHHGSIRLLSSGEGAAFEIRLPSA